MKIILALLLTATVLCGAAIDFRSGKVLCAEISTNPPARLKKLVNPVFPDLPATPAYAALTVFLDEGRSISLHDYAIHIFGKNYHCIAIQHSNRFLFVADRPASGNSNWEKVETVNPKALYTLFFMIDANELNPNKERPEVLTVRALFHPSENTGDKIPFKKLGDKAFTPQNRIPPAGMMVMKK